MTELIMEAFTWQHWSDCYIRKSDDKNMINEYNPFSTNEWNPPCTVRCEVLQLLGADVNYSHITSP